MKEIKSISSPQLSSSKYGSDVNEVIKNIDENFKILSNRDFVKGDKGNSINTKTIEVILDSSIINGLKRAVKNQFGDNVPKQIDGIDVMDWFNDPGSITLIYETNNSGEVLISSLPYVFKDKRFINLSKASNVENYDNETDYSCVIYYNGSEFIAVQEFPTLYFDKEQGCFCWKINGVETGLEAVGPKGEDGAPGTFKIVRAQKWDTNDENIYVVTHVMHENLFVESFEGEAQVSICYSYGVKPGISVMVLVEDGEENKTYISEVSAKKGESVTYNAITVMCSDKNIISTVEPMTNNEVEELCNRYLG